MLESFIPLILSTQDLQPPPKLLPHTLIPQDPHQKRLPTTKAEAELAISPRGQVLRDGGLPSLYTTDWYSSLLCRSCSRRPMMSPSVSMYIFLFELPRLTLTKQLLTRTTISLLRFYRPAGSPAERWITRISSTQLSETMYHTSSLL